jgi:broad specificity phosphatase PhoE
METAARLEDAEIDAVYSSDLVRAIESVHAIAESRGLEVITDPAFREIDQGDWEGMRRDEIRTRWPDLWGPARHYTRRPGGESPQEVTDRALAGIRRIVEAHPDDTVVVAAHGGTIRWLVAAAMGLDVTSSARLRGLANGGLVALEVGLDGGRLAFGPVERMDGESPALDDPNQ